MDNGEWSTTAGAAQLMAVVFRWGVLVNHKRHKPKSARGGCLLCKPWKMNGVPTKCTEGEKFSDHKRRVVADKQVQETLFGETESYVDTLYKTNPSFDLYMEWGDPFELWCGECEYDRVHCECTEWLRDKGGVW